MTEPGLDADKNLPQYHLLPKDDADRIVDILRAAAGLPPIKTGDDTGGDSS